MRKCCFCIGLKDGVTIIGFLSLIVCIVEWVLSTSFNGYSHGILKEKGGHIVSLLEGLATDKFGINVNDEKIHSLKTNVQLLLNFVTGEFIHLILFSSKTKQLLEICLLFCAFWTGSAILFGRRLLIFQK